jgi:transcriptional regulator with XRE-family HTH domain
MLGRCRVGISALLFIVLRRNKVSRILGETIRAKRIKAGLSQEKLAERADLARNYIGNIERAEYKVTVEALARIAKALGVRVRDLVAKI